MFRLLIYLLVLTAILSSQASSEVIRLKNGVELHCEILDCSEENGLQVKRLDTGGVFDLKWEHILEKDVKAIMLARGYTDDEAKPILFKARRLWLRNGTYEIGIQIESDKPGMMCLQRLSKRYYFRPNEVKEMTFIDVEINEVYTLEELFQQKLGEKNPETAQDFFNIGVYCESVTHYTKALEMFETARITDENFKPDVINQKVRLLGDKIKETDATAHLDAVKKFVYRKKYSSALAKIDEFETLFPDSVQIGDKEKLKSKVLTKRQEYYQKKILTDYFTYMDNVARKVVMNKELTIDEVCDFAAEEMGDSIRKKLADYYQMTIGEIEELWTNRKGGGQRRSSYGTGTFILGEEKAKFIPVVDGGKKEADDKKKEEVEKPLTLNEKLQKRIEEIKKQKQRGGKRGRNSRVRMDDIGRSPEDWWATESPSTKKRFLISFYSEMSEEMNIIKVTLNPCPYCGGKGWLEQINTDESENTKVPCEVCKTLGVERLIIFK